LQLVTDPTPSSNPPTDCDGNGDYYFENVDAGLYDIVATCGGLTGQRKAEVIAEEYNHVWMTLMAPVPDGEFCVGKLGLPIDLDTPTADMAQWLGYGSGGACVTATSGELSGMTVIDFSGPNCTDMNDPSCAIQVNGLVVSMVSGFTGYGPDEQRIFQVLVEDSSQNTVTVYIDTVNGYFQPNN
jgi:hypothetical protein